MNVQLGINNCFAVKRWPLGKDWIRIVKEDLELDCAQFSFDLLDPILHKDSRDVMVEEIKKAIIKLRDDPELCQELGANARKAYEQKYSWKIMEQRLLSFYRKLT